MSTLKDVAEIAGVSVSTVSYVLSGKKTVRPETLKRIQDAIKQVDYCPNLLASGLKTNLSKTIGVVMWDMQNNYSIEVLRVMEDTICKYGYCMIVCDSDQSPEKEKKNLRRLLARNIDGLILMGSGNNVLSSYRNAQIPIVCIDRAADEAFLTVQSDSIAGGQMGTEYLLSKGRRKILFLGYDLDFDFSRKRLLGYKKAMELAGLSDEIHYEILPERTVKCAMDRVEKLLQDKFDYDAVFGCVDYYAIGAMNALIKHGYQVPEQVSILGFDGSDMGKLSIKELTAVAQPKQALGKAVVEYLMRLIRKEKIQEKCVLMEPYIIERETC